MDSVLYSFNTDDPFGKNLMDISAIGKKFGFIIPVKISGAVNKYLTDKNVSLDSFIRHLYRVYPDEGTFVYVQVPENCGIWVLASTCLETSEDQVVVCLAFPEEYKQ